MNNNICAVIAIKGFNKELIELQVNRALKCNSRFIEWRFDYIQNKNEINVPLLNYIKTIIPSGVSSIFTFRDFAEGGMMELELEQKKEVVIELFKAKPNYIDIEMNSLDDLAFINDLAINNRVNLIFSKHNFQNTYEFEKCIELINNFENELESLEFNQQIIKNSIFKLVFNATKFSDNFIPLDLCSYYKKRKRKIISFCMGNLGIFSRIFCVKFGSFLTYAFLDENVAPGQVKIEEMRKILDQYIK